MVAAVCRQLTLLLIGIVIGVILATVFDGRLRTEVDPTLTPVFKEQLLTQPSPAVVANTSLRLVSVVAETSAAANDDEKLLTGKVDERFAAVGTRWVGNTQLLRELLTELAPTPAPFICQQFEHSLVLPGGRSMRSDSVVGQVLSVFGTGERYHVRVMGTCSHRDVIIEYSITNVRNYELSGAFPDVVPRMAYVPAFEYDFNCGAPRSQPPAIVTTFKNTGEPLRRAFIEALQAANVPNYSNRNGLSTEGIMRLLDQSGIMLNIHQTPHHHTLEELRILPALMRGVIVISEVSPLSESVPYADFVLWARVEEIPQLAKRVSADYAWHYERIFGGGRLRTVLAGMRRQARADLAAAIHAAANAT